MSTQINQEQRINIASLEPECWSIIMSIETHLSKTGLNQLLRELIKIRTSQINKCVFCIDLHTRDAIRLGESQRRIFALTAWEESTLFTQEERAVLKLTEEITEIAKKGVTDETYQQVKEYYTDKEIAQIIIAINHMNFLNRVAVTSKLRV